MVCIEAGVCMQNRYGFFHVQIVALLSARSWEGIASVRRQTVLQKGWKGTNLNYPWWTLRCCCIFAGTVFPKCSLGHLWDSYIFGTSVWNPDGLLRADLLILTLEITQFVWELQIFTATSSKTQEPGDSCRDPFLPFRIGNSTPCLSLIE